MIGDRYWSTGITVQCHDEGRWSAEVAFYDAGFCDAGSTEGRLRMRYPGPLSTVLDTIKADAERLGIRWAAVPGTKPLAIPTVYYVGDGQNLVTPPPPNWRALVNAEAIRLGWVPGYDADGDATSSVPSR